MCWRLSANVTPYLTLWRRRGTPASAPTSADIGTAKDVLAGLVTDQWHEETILH
ncbi:hypothetical protein [Nonomuraea helvata]|uniref:Transposase n=1 Tax=Nonomuraea helvata TaxID=37484 RepID=A0ABV5SC87_9ACTN